MEWMLMPLRRYADFGGRSRRKEIWMFFLFQILLFSGLLFAAVLIGSSDPLASSDRELNFLGWLVVVAFGLLSAALIIPTLAVQVRRLHDINRNGWWVIIGYIPIVNYVGIIILLVFYCLEGTKNENRFGPDPKMSQNIGDVFS